MNVVVFDIETTELAPKGAINERDLCGMGISVACSFDYISGEYGIYMQDNLAKLWYRLVDAELITGFNILGFDLPILYCIMQDEIGTGGGGPDELQALDDQYAAMKEKTYDLYFEAKKGAGAGKFDRGFNCDSILRSTWGAHMAKTGNGKEAPQLWKDGKLGELASYCQADVHRERLIFERCYTSCKLQAQGYRSGNVEYEVTPPQSMLRMVGSITFPLEGDPPLRKKRGPAFVAPAPGAMASDHI